MKEYNYEICSINRDITARVFADTESEAKEMLIEELENDYELDLNEFDIELNYIVDIVKRVDVEED